MATVDNTVDHRAAPPMGGAAVDYRKWAARIAVPAGWLILLGLWAWAAKTVDNPITVPAPDKVAEAVWNLIESGDAASNFGVSLRQMLMGFAVAMVVGCVIGILAGRNRYWNAFFHSPMILLGNIPAITYAVLALIIFGIGPTGPMFAVVLVTFPYISIEVAAGTREVDEDLLSMSRAYGRTRAQTLRHVVIPFVMPFLFTATRAAFAVAWKVATLTELFGGSKGVGVQMRNAYETFSVVDTLAWLTLFVLFMLVVERVIFQRVENHLFRWRG
jgi:NitT/TauT family transport system permease protein